MRGREVADTGPGPVTAGTADDAEHARAAHPRPRPTRHDTTSLFAAFNIADGTVITELTASPATEFKKFLVAMDTAVPAELEVHLVCDKLATHKTPLVHDWLARRPTPAGSSWLHQVERWFAYLTSQFTQRGVHKASKPSKPTSAPASSNGSFDVLVQHAARRIVLMRGLALVGRPCAMGDPGSRCCPSGRCGRAQRGRDVPAYYGAWARILTALQIRADAAGLIAGRSTSTPRSCGPSGTPPEPGGTVTEPTDHALGRSCDGLSTEVHLSREQR